MPKPVYPTTEAKLHDEILAFQSWAMLTPQEAEARRLIVDCIHTVVKRHLNDAETLVFGSCATSLALPSSDIDIVVSTKEIWTEIDMKLVMSQLAILLKVVELTKHVVKIPSARVPILKFTALSEYGSFGVDISINNTTGLQAVNVVNDYLSKMPALRPLVLAVKALLAKYGLNNPSTGGLGSYAVICMCIFFIKTNPSKRPLSFYDLPLISGSLGTLLSDFLWYFSSEFPYSTSCISAKDGCLYPSLDSKHRMKKGHCMSVQCLLNPGISVHWLVENLRLT
ncbi:Nucleotidyltransferase [Amanita muscaria]